MRSMITALVSGALLLTAVGAAADEEESPYARPGGYIGIGAIGVWDTGREQELEDKAAVRSANVDFGWGLDARGGWRHSDHIASEFVLGVVIDYDVRVGRRKNETRDIMGSYNLKIPFLTHRVQPYAVAGLGFLYSKIANTTEGDSTTFMARAGLGLDIYATENWVLNTEASYVFPTGYGEPARRVGKVNRLDFLSLGMGVAYRF